MPLTPDYIATITYLPLTEGGRQTPVTNGYRGAIEFDHLPGFLTSGDQQFIPERWVHPGETAQAYVTTLMTDYHVGLLHVGAAFQVKEGGQLVGTGSIIEFHRQEQNRALLMMGIINQDTLVRYAELLPGLSSEIWNSNDPLDIKYLRQLLAHRQVWERLGKWWPALDELFDALCANKEVHRAVLELPVPKRR